MKMMIVVVRDSDADAVIRALTEKEFRVTRVASTGGFLRSGIATLLIGVEDTQVEEAVQVLRGKLSPLANGERRATLFVVPVERFEQV